MPIANTGPISFGDLQSQLGGSNPISLNEYFSSTDGSDLGLGGNLNRGYYGPGDSGGAYANVIDRLDYSTETFTRISATKPVGSQLYATVESSTKGYWCGSYESGSEIDAIDFSTDTSTNPAAVLSVGRGFAAGVSSSTKGYIGGGVVGSVVSGGAVQTEIDGIQFSNEAAINPSATLATARCTFTGIESSTRGYFCGGANIGFVISYREIDGIQFSDEAAINPSAGLFFTTRSPGSTSFTTKGYVVGGVSGGSLSNISDGLIFSTETGMYLGGVLSVARENPMGTDGNSFGALVSGSVSGVRQDTVDMISYITNTGRVAASVMQTPRDNAGAVTYKSTNFFPKGKGFNGYGDGATFQSTVDRYDFTTGLCAVSAVTMASSRQLYAGVHSSTRGYWCGAAGDTTEIDGIQFSDETAINPSGGLQLGRGFATGVVSSTNGYIGGGLTAGTTVLSNIERLQFSSETTTSLGATLSIARYITAGINSSTKGYWCGGYDLSVEYNEIDGILFSNETAINPSSVLGRTLRFSAGTSSAVAGYVAGGITAGFSPLTSADRISFPDDTVSIISVILGVGRERLSGIYNSSEGIYMGGLYGGVYYNSIDGINFYTESQFNPAAVLTVAKMNAAGVSAKGNSFTRTTISADSFRGFNSHRGYFGGGFDSSQMSEIDGIQFSDETAINPSATLSLARNVLAGVNSSIRGYFGGGFTAASAPTAEMDGIQFSNETSINPTSVLSVSRFALAGLNSSIKGYFVGGATAGTVATSEIDGIRFSNETAINPTITLSVARYYSAGVSSESWGYCAGGDGGQGEIDSIQFQNETTFNTSATLNTYRSFIAGVNSFTRGYFGGGNTGINGSGSDVNEIDGIIFSSGVAINPSATLSFARYGASGVNSTTRGYFVGGYVTGSGINTSEIDGIQFSDETAINPSAALSVARRNFAGVQSGSL
jgi:hypothetical protein